MSRIWICFFLVLAAQAMGSPERALEYVREGEYQSASELLREHLRSHPGDFQQHYNLGVALFRSEQLEEAGRSFERAAQTDDRSLKSKALYNKSQVQISRGDIDGAKASLRDSLSYDLENTMAKENLEWLLTLDNQQQQDQEQSGEDQQDGEQKDGQQQDGQQQDGQQQDGQQQEGQQQDGQQQEGQQQDGQQQDGQQQEGQQQDGQQQDGQQQDGQQQDGQQQEGQQQDGQQRQDSANAEKSGQEAEAEAEALTESEQAIEQAEDQKDQPKATGIQQGEGQQDTANTKVLSQEEMAIQNAEKLLRSVEDKVGRFHLRREDVQDAQQSDNAW